MTSAVPRVIPYSPASIVKIATGLSVPPSIIRVAFLKMRSLKASCRSRSAIRYWAVAMMLSSSAWSSGRVTLPFGWIRDLTVGWQL